MNGDCLIRLLSLVQHNLYSRRRRKKIQKNAKKRKKEEKNNNIEEDERVEKVEFHAKFNLDS